MTRTDRDIYTCEIYDKSDAIAAIALSALTDL